MIHSLSTKTTEYCAIYIANEWEFRDLQPVIILHARHILPHMPQQPSPPPPLGPNDEAGAARPSGTEGEHRTPLRPRLNPADRCPQVSDLPFPPVIVRRLGLLLDVSRPARGSLIDDVRGRTPAVLSRPQEQQRAAKQAKKEAEVWGGTGPREQQ